MTRYVYVGDEGRYYPSLSLTPSVGAAYELPDMPADGRWELEQSASAVADTARVEAPEPEPAVTPLPDHPGA